VIGSAHPPAATHVTRTATAPDPWRRAVARTVSADEPIDVVAADSG
jgi:hypothetical protein